MQALSLYGHWERYLDLFGYIYREGLFNNDEFAVPDTEHTISIDYIKARAFEEIYADLPTKQELKFIIDKFDFINPSNILEILKEIPTRVSS